MKLDLIEKEARRCLAENPFDEGHDLEHHQAVVDNCKLIIESQSMKVDRDVLLSAAWWHDYERNSPEKAKDTITSVFQELGCSEDFLVKVLTVIDSHSFGNKQTTLEQKVLFDADKLEYVSVDRFIKVAKALKNGKMSQEVFDKYKKAWEERIPQVARLMHFDSSKKIFQERLSEIRKLVKTNKVWSGLVLPKEI